MNTSRNEALALVSELAGQPHREGVEVVIFPPLIWLGALARALSGSSLSLGGQDCSAEPQGAYTGQISASMLAELCSWVIVGHSERRRDFGESNELVGRKSVAAGKAGLKPIICVGESLDARENDQQERIVGAQVEAVLNELSGEKSSEIVFAYEPVWAIGTGRSASAEDAQRMAYFIRRRTADQLGERTRILYGGSVMPENAASFLQEQDVDGLLVGGASLKADKFQAIIEAC